MKIHAIILARGGSKGIPHKNIIDFCGSPLLAWTIDCARRCAAVETVWVSTDSEEIATVALRFGAQVIDRPECLSNDTASSETALIHAAEVISQGGGQAPTHFLFLQPTSPLREAWEIDEATRRFSEEQLDSLFSAAPAEDFCLWRRHEGCLSSLNFDYQNRGRRQDRPDDEVWIETGSFYLTSIAGLVRSGNRLHGKIGFQPTEGWKAFEIDGPASLDLCRAIFSAKLLPHLPSPIKK